MSTFNIFRAEVAVSDAMIDLENEQAAALTDSERVAEYLKLACNPTVAEIAADCGLTRRAVKRILKTGN